MEKLIEKIYVLCFETLSPMIFGICIYLLFAEVIPQKNHLLWLWWAIVTVQHGIITILDTIDHLRSET